MTTIAYRKGLMAADSRAYSGSAESVGIKDKVFKLIDGRLLGVSSNCLGIGVLVRDWILDGMKQDKVPLTRNKDDFDALLVSPDGTAFIINGLWMPSGPIKANYFSIGTGSHYAKAAMRLGCTAVQAVDIACELDIWSDLPIVVKDHILPKEGEA